MGDITNNTSTGGEVIKPILSVIIPCYNNAESLRETLDCLQNQTLDDWECIIVNDGSTDNSLDIIIEYAQKDPRYKFVDKINEGPAVARNTAIAVSSGKYIVPLDADDLIAPTYTEKAVKYLEEHPKTKVVYCQCEFFGDRRGKWNLPEYNYEELLYGNCIFCSCVYRRTDFNKTRGYNPNMKLMDEDWDFLLSLLEPDDEVYCIPEPLFFYRQHGITRTWLHRSKIDMSHLQLIINHPELYSKNLERSFQFVSSMSHYYEKKACYYEQSLNEILDSNAYKLGNFLIKPIRWLKRTFSGHNICNKESDS